MTMLITGFGCFALEHFHSGGYCEGKESCKIGFSDRLQVEGMVVILNKRMYSSVFCLKKEKLTV